MALSALSATPPPYVTYQGRLYTGSLPATTTLAMSFVMYDAPTGGAALYTAAGTLVTPSTINVTPSNGLFTVYLGDTGTNALDPAIFQNNSDVYLEISIGGETLNPRKRIISAPFAFNAKYLDGIGATSTPSASAYIPVSDATGNLNLNRITSTGIVATGQSNLATTTISSSTIGSANITNIIANSITTTNFSGGSFSGTNATFVNLTSTNFSGTNAVVANLTSTNQYAVGLASQNFVSTNATTTNIYSSGIVALNLVATNATTTNLFSTGLTFTNLSGTNATTTNLNSTNIVAANATTTNFYTTNFGVGNINFTSATGTNLNLSGLFSFANANGTSLTSTNFYAALSNIVNAVTGNITSTNLSVSGVTSLGNTTITSVTSTNENTNRLTFTSATGTNLYVSGPTILNNVTGTNLGITGSTNLGNTTVSNLTSTNFGFTAANGISLTSTYIYTPGLTFLNANGTSITSTNLFAALSAFTNANGTSLTSSNAFVSLLGYTSASGESLTSTNLFASLLGATNVNTTNLTATNATATNLTSTNIYNSNQLVVSGTSTFATITATRVGVGTTSPREGVHIYDNTLLVGDTVNPTVIGFTSSSSFLSSPQKVYVSGRYAYVVSGGTSTFAIIDVSNPSAPTTTGYINNEVLGGGTKDLKVVGKYAYVVSNASSSLAVINVSNPTLPVFVGSLIFDATTANQPQALYVSGKYAYVAISGTNDAVSVVDISDPMNLHVVGSVVNSTILNGAADIYVKGKYAYVAAGSQDGMAVVDISVPTSPIIVGSFADNFYLDTANEIFVNGNYAYIAAGGTGSRNVAVMDISDPTNPTVAEYTPANYFGTLSMYVSGDYIYLLRSGGNILYILNAKDPKNIYQVGSLTDATYINAPTDVFVVGKYAYITAAGTANALTIVDLKGADISTARIGSLESGNFSASENVDIGNDLYVGHGLILGPGGLYSQGPVSITSSSSSTLPLLTVNGGSLLATVSSTNLYVSSSLSFVSATGTNLNLSGLFSYANANGTSLTSTYIYSPSLTFQNASGTAITTTYAYISNLQVGNCIGCASGGGGGSVNTSTANYFAYYLNNTSVTGTPLMVMSGNTISISGGLDVTGATTITTSTITYLNATNVTTTNLLFTNATGTNLRLNNQLSVAGTSTLASTTIRGVLTIGDPDSGQSPPAGRIYSDTITVIDGMRTYIALHDNVEVSQTLTVGTGTFAPDNGNAALWVQGQVGINTPLPSTSLHVVGSFMVTGTSTLATTTISSSTITFLNFRNATGTNAVISNVTTTNIYVSGATNIGTINFTNATGTNLNLAGLFSFANANGTNITSTNIFAALSAFTNANGISLTSTNIFAGLLNTSNATIGNVTATNFYASNIPTVITGSATATNVFATNSVFVNAITGNLTSTNLNVSGVTNLGNTTITSVTTTNENTNRLTFTSATGTNLYVSGPTVLTNVTGTNLGITGSTNLGNTTISNLTSTNFGFTTANGVSLTSTYIYTPGLSFQNANGTSITSTNLFAALSAFTNANGTSLTSTNIYGTGVVFQNASGTSLTSTYAYISNLQVGNCIGCGSGSGGGAVNTSTANYFAYYLNNTSVTGTPLMVMSGNTISISGGLSASGATTITTSTITYLNATNVTTTNLVFVNATGTNMRINNQFIVDGNSILATTTISSSTITFLNFNTSSGKMLSADAVVAGYVQGSYLGTGNLILRAGDSSSGISLQDSNWGALMNLTRSGIDTFVTSTFTTTTISRLTFNSATGTNLNLSGLFSYQNASGVNLTSTYIYATNLTGNALVGNGLQILNTINCGTDRALMSDGSGNVYCGGVSTYVGGVRVMAGPFGSPISSTNTNTASVITNGPALLLAFITTERTGGATPMAVTAVTGGGLTWQKAVGGADPVNSTYGSEIWYAYASSALTNVTVTSTVNNPANFAFSVVAVTGVNTSSPIGTTIGPVSSTPATNLTANFGNTQVGSLMFLTGFTPGAGTPSAGTNTTMMANQNTRTVLLRSTYPSLGGTSTISEVGYTSGNVYYSGVEIKASGQTPIYGGIGVYATSSFLTNVAIGTTTPSARLHVFDGTLLVDNPSSLRTMGTFVSSSLITSWADDIKVIGRYAYIASSGGLNRFTILDVSNPAKPAFVGSVSSTQLNDESGLAVAGKYAYFYNNSKGTVNVVDISDVSQPTIVGMVSSTYLNYSYSHGIDIAGNYLYVGGGQGLVVIDISNPINPVVVGYLDIGLAPGEMRVVGKYLYATRDITFSIFDISDPKNPVEKSTITNAYLDNNTDLYISGKYAYVTSLNKNGLAVIDVSSSTNPTVVGFTSSTALSDPNNLKVAGKYAYVTQSDGHLVVVDISSSTAPTTTANFATTLGNLTSIDVVGKYAYMMGLFGMEIVDLQGADISTANIGNIATNDLTVWDDAFFGNNIYVRNALNVGIGGIKSEGGLSVLGETVIKDGGLVVDSPVHPKKVGSVGMIASAAHALAVSGKFAYNAGGNSLSVYNISNPKSPVFEGSVTDASNIPDANFLAVVGDYAYITNYGLVGGLTIVDISNPETPRVVGVARSPALVNADDVYISGKYAYVVADSTYLSIIDISNPTVPTTTAILNVSATERVFVSGNYAYLTGGSSLLQVVDIKNPLNPTLIATLNDGRMASGMGLYVLGNKAYVAANSMNGLAIVDISDPAGPSVVGFTSSTQLNGANSVFVSGKYAYLGADAPNTFDTFTVVDISDPIAPTTTGYLTDPAMYSGNPGMKVQGRYAYVASKDTNSLTVVDLLGADISTANIGNLFTDQLTVAGNASFGNNLYIRNGLNVGTGGILSDGPVSVHMVNSSTGPALRVSNGTLLVDNPVTPKRISFVQPPYGGDSWISISGKYAYSTFAGSEGFGVFDIADINNPTLISFTSPAPEIVDLTAVAISGKYAYVTSYSKNGLLVIDISNPYAPTTTAFTSSSSMVGAQSIYLSGKYAYVGGGWDTGLTIVDISNPSAPTTTGYISGIYALNTVVIGKYAYMTGSWSDSLYIADISNPKKPVLVSTLASPTQLEDADGLYVSGKYAYVGSPSKNALAIVDISNPSAPAITGFVSSSLLNTSQHLYVAGKYAYVGTDAGLTVVDISNPAAPFVVGVNRERNSLVDVKVVGKYVFATANSELHIYDIGGADISAANIGSIATNDLTVWENVDVGNNLYVKNGLNVGLGGIATDGNLNVLGTGEFKGQGISTIVTQDLSTNATTKSSVNNNVGSLTWSHSVGVTGQDSFLLVGATVAGNFPTGTPITSVTYGSSTLTRIRSNTSRLSVEYWYLQNPPIGTKNITITLQDANAFTITAGATNWTKVNPINPFSGFVSTTDNDVTARLTVTSTPGAVVYGLLMTDSGDRRSTVADEFQLWMDEGGYNGQDSAYAIAKAGKATTTLTWVMDSTGSHTRAAISINPDPSAVALKTTISKSGNAATFVGGKVGVGTENPAEKLHVFDGTLLVDSPVNPNIVGYHLPNFANQIINTYVSGKYAYAGSDSGLYIIDISNPLAPTTTGYMNTSLISSVFVSGKYAYALRGEVNRLDVIDVSNPAAPTIVGFTSSSNLSGAWDVVVSGKYAYASVNNKNGLAVIDISNPAAPTTTGFTSSSRMNAATGIYMQGSKVYVTSDFGIATVDVSNPYAPTTTASSSPTRGGCEAVYVSGKYAYCAHYSGSAFTIFDISSSTSISEISNIYDTTYFSGPKDITVSGKYAYVVSRDGNRLVTIDISDATSPRIVGGVQSAAKLNTPNSIFIAGRYAYISSFGAGSFSVVDIGGADITNANIGNIASNDLTVWENVDIGNNLYIRNGLNVGWGGIMTNGGITVMGTTTLATTTISNLIVTSCTGCGSSSGGTTTWTFNGSNVFLVTSTSNVGIGTNAPSSALHVVDGTLTVDRPVNPTLVTVFDDVSSTDGFGIDVSGKYAYYTDSLGAKMFIVDISNPAYPRRAGVVTSTLLTGAAEVRVSGKYAYVKSSSKNLLAVIDVSNVSAPSIVGYVSSTAIAGSDNIFVTGKYVYAASASINGLVVIDVSNPRSPFIAGSVSNAGNYGGPSTIYVSGRYAYMGDGWGNPNGGLTITDISDPTNPVFVGRTTSQLLEAPWGLYVSGKYAYVASAYKNGLAIVDISNPASPTTTGFTSSSLLYSANDLQVAGKYAYVSGYGIGGIVVVDISSSTAPTTTGSLISGSVGQPQGIAVSGKYAYTIDRWNGILGVYDIKGADISAANIGSIATNDLTVWENVDIGSNLYVRNGLNVGLGGIMTDGGLSSYGTSTFAINPSSTVGIGTSNPNAKLHVFDGTLLVDNPVHMKVAGYYSDFSRFSGYAGVYVSGKYMYMTPNDYNAFAVMDVSNPANPTLIGYTSSTYLGDAGQFAVSGNYAYVVSYLKNGLAVVDFSNPKSPTTTGFVSSSLLYQANAVAISGKYAFVVGVVNDNLTVIDISNPRQPTIVSSLSGIDTGAKISINGRYAYIAGHYTDSLKIVDISNPLAPVLLSTLTDVRRFGYTTGIHVSGKYAYLTSGDSNGLAIVDISTTTAPTSTGFTSSTEMYGATSVYISGKYAYVASVNGIASVDISDPRNPTTTGFVVTPWQVDQMQVSGKYLYASMNSGLVIIDIGGADITNANIGNIATNNLTVWENADIGNSLFVRNSLNVGLGGIMTDGILSSYGTSTLAINPSSTVGIGTNAPKAKLHVFDGTLLVDNPTPVLVGDTGYVGTQLLDVEVSGKYAYIANYSLGGLYIYDISNPTNPIRVGTTTDLRGGDAYDVAVSGRYAYVAGRSNSGLTVVDVSNPSAPTTTGFVSSTQIGQPVGLDVQGQFAYTIGNTGFSVIEISNPRAPILRGTYSITGEDVYVAGKYAYIADATDNALVILDVSDPRNPVLAGGTAHSVKLNNVRGVYVSGRYAYLTSYYSNGLAIVDISNPALATTTGFTSSSFLYNAISLKVAGKYAYVSTANGVSNDRLTLVDISNPSSPTTTNSTIIGVGAVGLDVAGKYAYIVTDGGYFQIVDLKGADIANANIGSIATNDLTVWENVDIGNNLFVRNGLNVGLGGIITDGGLSSYGTSTFAINPSSTVGIGTNAPKAKLHVFDGALLVSNPTPALVGATNYLSIIVNSIDVSGKYAYVSTYDALGMQVFDISNPYNPFRVGSTTDARISQATTVHVSGNYGYLVSRGSAPGLFIMDISNPAAPTTTGFITSSAIGSPYDVAIVGKYAYLVGGNFAVIDVSNPRAPSVVSTFSQTGRSVVVSGKYAYIADDSNNRLAILDVSNPYVISAVGSTTDNTRMNNASDIYVSGRYAYVTAINANGLSIIDISNPAAPTTTGFTSSSYLANAISLDVAGKYAYVIGSGFSVVDISDPTAPTTTNYLNHGGSNNEIEVVGKYAYVAHSSGYVRIYDLKGADISTANIGSVATNDLTVFDNADIGGSLYVRTGLNVGIGGIMSDGPVAINISSSTQPALRVSNGTLLVDNPVNLGVVSSCGSGCSTVSEADGIVVSGKYAYVAAHTNNGLAIFDISNPADGPKQIGFTSSTALAHASGVAVAGKYAYVASGATNGLAVVDVSNPAAPTTTGFTSSSAMYFGVRVVVQGKYAYVASYNDTPGGGFAIVDISNPYAPTTTGYVNSASYANTTDIYVSGKYAYITGYSGNRFGIFDISNPASPVEVGFTVHATKMQSPSSLTVSGKYAYVSRDLQNSFSIVDISNPAAPTTTGFTSSSKLSLNNSPRVAGKYVYVLSNSGFAVIDVSSSTAPTTTGYLNNSAYFGEPTSDSMVISGKYAYSNSRYSGRLTITDLKGAEISAASIGNIATNELTVTENADIGNNLYVRNGLNVGQGGIYSNGPVSIYSTSTISTSSLFTVYGTSTLQNVMPAQHLTYYLGNTSTRWKGIWTEAINIGSSTWSITQDANGQLSIFDQPNGGGTKRWSLSPTGTNYVAGTTTFANLSVAGNCVGCVSLSGTGTIGTWSYSGTNVFLTTSTSNVGVGTSAPSTTLHVTGGTVLLDTPSFTTSSSNFPVSNATDIAIQGKYAYVVNYTTSKILVLDISNPLSMRQVGSVTTTVALNGVFIQGKYLYATGETNGTAGVYDISNPTAPVEVYWQSSLSNVPESVVQGKYWYRAESGAGLQIYDVTDPYYPKNVAEVLNGVGAVQGVNIFGKYLYVNDLTANLNIYDISDPVHPVTTSASTAGGERHMYISGGHLYSAYTSSGDTYLNIDDVSNPAAVSDEADVLIKTGVDLSGKLVISGKYAYVGTNRGISIVNISSTTAPYPVRFVSSTDVYNLVVSGKYLFIADGTGGVRSYDLGGLDALAATIGAVSTNDLTVWEDAKVGNSLYVRNTLSVGVGGITSDGQVLIRGSASTTEPALHVSGGSLSVDNPVNPMVVGFTSSSYINGSNAVYVSGKYAYAVGNGGATGLSIIDISNPTRPTTTGWVSVSYPYDVVVAGKYAYVSDYGTTGLHVIDVSNPSAPVIVGSVSDATNLAHPDHISVSGNYVYVADSAGNRLTVISVANPTKPRVVGSVNDYRLNNVSDVFVSGRYAYTVQNNSSTLTVVDINTSSKPTVVGMTYHDTYLSGAESLYVSGRYAYVADYYGGGLAIVDISSSTRPTTTGYVAGNGGWRTGITVAGKYAYITSAFDNQLIVVDISSSTNPVQIKELQDDDKLNFALDIEIAGKYAYVIAEGSNMLTIIDINGAEISAASIGNVAQNSLTVWENADIGGNLYVRSGLNVGGGGINTAGELAVFQTSTLFGRVLVGTSSPFTTARLGIDAGTSTAYGLAINGYARSSGGFFASTSLDLAERYPIDPSCEAAGNCPMPGDVICQIENTTTIAVEKCSVANSPLALGIVSTEPGFVLEGGYSDENSRKIALAGRVPIRVSTANGDIKPGDLLAPSSIPGVAVKANAEGVTVGKALEIYTDGAVNGFITAYVQLGWNHALTSAVNGVSSTTPTSTPAGFLDSVVSVLKNIGITIQQGIIQATQFIADKITTKELCVGNTCVNENQLQELLQKNSISTSTPTAPIVIEPMPTVPPVDATPTSTPTTTPVDISIPTSTPPAETVSTTPPSSEPAAVTPTPSPTEPATTPAIPADTTTPAPTDTTTPAPADTTTVTPPADTTTVTPPADTTAPATP